MSLSVTTQPPTDLRTATSLRKAWNCSGVGSVTFKILTATSPVKRAGSHHSVVNKGTRAEKQPWLHPRLAELTHRATSLCRPSRRSRSRSVTAASPHWPRSPSSSWSPACLSDAGHRTHYQSHEVALLYCICWFKPS